MARKENATKLINDMISLVDSCEYDEVDIFIQDLVYEIVEIRKRKCISQENLAELSGLTQSTISRVETFRVTPTLPILYKILHALNCKLTLTIEQ